MLRVTTGRAPGATSGGTLVTTRNHATGAIETSGAGSIQLVAVNAWVPFELSWSVTGYQTSQAVVLPATTDIEWSANGSTGVGANTPLNAGIIGNAAVRVYVRALATRALGNLLQTVSNIVYGYGVEAQAAPVFTQAPAVVSVDQTSGIFTFSASDPNTGGSVASAKYQVVARGATLGSWGSAATATSPQAFSGLTAATDYDLVVQLTDDTGLTTTSSRYQFQTAQASSTAPYFTAQPALKAASQTSQGFTVTYAVANPGGFALIHKASLDGGDTYQTLSVGTQGEAGKRYFNTSTQLWEYTVSGLASGSRNVKIQVLGDVYTVDSSTVAIATGTLSLVGSLSFIASDQQLVVDFPDAIGGANGYDVEYGTTNAYGSTVSPDPVTSTATIIGLINDTTYYVRVRAHDSAGNLTDYLTGTGAPGSFARFKTLNFTGAAGAGTNYQMRLVIAKAADDGTSDFGLDGNVSNWPYDIEFRASNGTTVYPYWRESYTADYQIVWVKVGADLSTNQSIRCYYGKAAHADASSMANTWNWYDDFSGAAVDTAEWTVNQGDVGVVGGNLVLTGTTGTRGIITGKDAHGPGIRLLSSIKPSDTTIGSAYWITVTDGADNFVSMNGNGALNGVNTQLRKGGTSETLVGATASLANAFSVWELDWATDKVMWKQGNTVFRTVTTATYIPTVPLYPRFVEAAAVGDDVTIEYIVVGKYQSTEPAFASVA